MAHFVPLISESGLGKAIARWFCRVITMNDTRKICRLIAQRLWLIAASLTLTLGSPVRAGDLHLPLLRTRTGFFTNVTVMAMSKSDIFVKHSLGIGNIKLIDLDAETLRRMGLGAPAQKGGTWAGVASSVDAESAPTDNSPSVRKRFPRLALSSPLPAIAAALPSISSRVPSIRLEPNILILAASLLLGGYLFFCYCLKLICEKSGQPPGGLIWIPALQLFPLLRAARMRGWWFLAFLIPGVNLIAQAVWSIKIARARGKSAWVGVFLILPLINLIAFVYLSFSGAGNAPQEKVFKLGLPPAAALGEA